MAHVRTLTLHSHAHVIDSGIEGALQWTAALPIGGRAVHYDVPEAKHGDEAEEYQEQARLPDNAGNEAVGLHFMTNFRGLARHCAWRGGAGIGNFGRHGW